MRIIALVTQKGGTGKSTLAVNLAVAAEGDGERVVVVDLDPQRTAVQWFENRAAETPVVVDHNAVGGLESALPRLAEAGFTLVIIDTPGSDSHATRGAMRAADLCLVPVRPSEADLKATEPTIRALTALARPFALVINQAPTSRQVRLTGAVNMRLRAFGDVAPTALAARIDHQYAYALGLGAMEFAGKGKAATEVAELWSWCKKKMGGHAHGHETKRRA